MTKQCPPIWKILDPPLKTDKITNRHLAIIGMNETEVEITTVSARETTGNSVDDAITDEITNRSVNETEVITTNYLPDTTRNDETDIVSTANGLNVTAITVSTNDTEGDIAASSPGKSAECVVVVCAC